MGKLSCITICCKIHINHPLLLLLFNALPGKICEGVFARSLSLLNANASKICWAWLRVGGQPLRRLSSVFHPRVSSASCIKFGSFTWNKETLLLQTLLLSSVQALSSPNTSATSGQISLQRAEAAVFTGAQTGHALVAPREDRQRPGSLEAGAAPGWMEGRGPTGIRGLRQGPHASRDGTRTPCPAWGSSQPRPPHADSGWLQPISTPLPLSLNLACSP